jgi:hypothetical protein
MDIFGAALQPILALAPSQERTSVVVDDISDDDDDGGGGGAESTALAAGLVCIASQNNGANGGNQEETGKSEETHAWHTGDKCYHLHSWREGTVRECPEGDYMDIAFNQQQKKACWCGWSGWHDGATETRRKFPWIKGESPGHKWYWSEIRGHWHDVDDLTVKTQLLARSQVLQMQTVRPPLKAPPPQAPGPKAPPALKAPTLKAPPPMKAFPGPKATLTVSPLP